MKDRILKSVAHFLKVNHQNKGPLLLGFSGGSDSLTLLHALLDCQRFFPLKICVAHLDHGWRKESLSEALALKEYVENLGLPFFYHTIESKVKSEQIAREERMAFFAKLYAELGCQALILGHQADDQAETVLKRVLEGAHFLSLAGIRPVSERGQVRVWRPLLGHSKKEIREWLEKRSLVPLEDYTNQDLKFLRARMRESILPGLSEAFGKQISCNLQKLGDFSADLNEYFEKKTAVYFSRLVRVDGSIFIDLRPLYPFEKMELKVFLRQMSDRENWKLSYAALEDLYWHINEGSFDKKILTPSLKTLYVHGRTLKIE